MAESRHSLTVNMHAGVISRGEDWPGARIEVSEVTLATSTTYGGVENLTKRRDRFFLAMSAVLLLILLVGFAPTLYLRMFFDVPPIPFYLHVHGIAVTSWFVWLLLQASLVNIHRADIHRRIGLAGTVVGVGVVITGLLVTLRIVRRLPEIGLDLESSIYLVSWIVWANFAMLLAFVVFLSTALVLRRRAVAHKRLMVLASMSVIAPALARIAHWQVFNWIAEPVFVATTWLFLLVVLVLYDLVSARRLQMVTAVGGSYFALTVLVPLVVASTDFAQAFVRGLG